MADELQRLVIDNFKGLSTTKAANRIGVDKTPAINGMFITPKNALTPIPLVTSQNTGFTKITNLIPTQFSNNTKYIVVTDGVDFKYSAGDVNFPYLGYTTGTVTRSGTALTGTSTAWLTNIQAGDQFKYDADSSWLNIATVNSDTSITLSSGSGATSGAYMIRKVMSNAVRPKGVMLNDLLILCDGVRIADKWDGTSLQTISGMPIMRGLELHKRHIFGFDKDKIYWSDINVPTTWTATNLEAIATKDGGENIAIKSYAESLFIFKSNGRIYSLVGEAPFSALTPNYNITQISVPSNFGIVAPETISIHNNLLRFQTSTGIWDFDGISFELITRDIQSTVADILIPSTLGSSSFVDDTSGDFSAGTASDVEFDSTNSRFQLDQDKVFDDFTDGDYTSNPTWTVSNGSWSVSSNALQSASGVGSDRISAASTNAYGTWEAEITLNGGPSATSEWGFIASSTHHTPSNGYALVFSHNSLSVTLRKIVANNIGTTLLTIGSGFALGTSSVYKVTRNSSGTFEVFIDGVSKGTATDTTYTTSVKMFVERYTGANNGQIIIDDIKTSALSGTFTSQVFDGTTSLIRWDALVVDATLNGETLAIEYRAEASTPPSGAWTTLVSGQSINSANRYLQYRLTFTSSTKVGITPYVNAVTVNYSSSVDGVNKPVAISFKDRWHLSYCTQGSSNTNMLIQDEAGEWITSSNEAACFAIFNSQLYSGNPAGTIAIFYVGSTAISEVRSWKSPILEFSMPEYTKFIERIIVVHKFTSATVTVGYSINQGSFTTTDVSLAQADSTDIPVRTVQVAKAAHQFQVQLSFTAARESEDFEIYGIIIYWKPLELR